MPLQADGEFCVPARVGLQVATAPANLLQIFTEPVTGALVHTTLAKVRGA